MKPARRIIYVLIATALIGVVVFKFYGNKQQGPAYTTAAVGKADLKQTVEATGSVASAEELSLAFKLGGKIQRVDAVVGAHVKQGQVLAYLQDSALNSELENAQAAVASAQADLDRLLAGAKPGDVAVSVQQVEKAKVAWDAARATLDNMRTTQTRAHQVYADTALQAIVDAAFVGEYTAFIVYEALLDPQSLASFDTTKTQAWQEARTRYNQSIDSLSKAKTSLAVAQASRVDVDILKALQDSRLAFDTLSSLLDYSFETISGAIVNSSFSQTTINDLRTSLNTRASAVAASKTSIQASINNLTSGIQDLTTKVNDAEFGSKSAEKSYQLAQAQYLALIDKPQSYEIDQQRARLLQATANVRSAQSKVGDMVISAPVDGTVTGVDHKAGEIAASNQVIIRMIGDSKLQIDVDISESDITKVSVGQKVIITLDAFGSDVFFDGTVAFIEPSQRLIQDVVYYRVTVVFIEQRDTIKPGMTATIRIATAEHNGVLAVPLRAVVISIDGIKSVRVLKADTTVETRTVTTGIRGDEGTVEVLSGLIEGDVVILGETAKK